MMLIRMHTVSRQEMSLKALCLYYTHAWICTHPTHSHIHTDTDAQAHTIIHTSKHIYTNAHKHVSTPTHIPAHIFSCTHIRAYYLHTHARALKHTCIQNNKCFHRHYTQRIYTQIHSYVNTPMNMRQHSESIDLYTRTYTCALTFMCARAHPWTTRINMYDHRQTYKHACMHSITHAHTYTFESVRSVCVRVCA